MDTINKIIRLLNENGRSQKELTDSLGIEKSVFSAWKNGSSKSYNKYISQISEFFNVSTDYLVGNSIKFDFSVSEMDEAQIKCPVCNDECLNFNGVVAIDFENMKSTGAGIELRCPEGHISYLILESNEGNTYLAFVDEHCNLDYKPKIPYENAPVSLAELWIENSSNRKKYDCLDEFGKKALQQLLEVEYERCCSADVKGDKPQIIMISKHLNKASAGCGYDLRNEDEWKRVKVVADPISERADFAVEVEGDSMLPDYHDGDLVLIVKDTNVPVGKVGLFQQGGKGYIKECGEDHLISRNPDFPDIYGEVRCIGRVIGIATVVD